MVLQLSFVRNPYIAIKLNTCYVMHANVEISHRAMLLDKGNDWCGMYSCTTYLHQYKEKFVILHAIGII